VCSEDVKTIAGRRRNRYGLSFEHKHCSNKCLTISLYTTEKRTWGEGERVVLIGILSACEEAYMEAEGGKKKNAGFYRTIYIC